MIFFVKDEYYEWQFIDFTINIMQLLHFPFSYAVFGIFCQTEIVKTSKQRKIRKKIDKYYAP